FSSYANGWYQTGVYLNGEYKRGYIKASDVDVMVSNPESREGTGLKSPTHVYASTSTGSKKLKSYKKGSTLKYSTFSENWYRTGVYINGKKHIGYIRHEDVSASKKKVVYLDAGHGGNDPGTSKNGLVEKTLTLDIAKRTRDQLESNGFIVIMSRTSDITKSLVARTNEANKAKADIFVSIHINAGGGTGIETWTMRSGPKPKESNILAREIQNEVIKETKMRDRGIKEGNLHVNRESEMPSSLVEVGFIDTTSDAEKLKKASFKNKAAKGIANGIKSYLDRKRVV